MSIKKIEDSMHGKKVISNSIISVAYKITMLLLGFVTRRIFILYIGDELLGLNSVYANLLDLLNFADLGIGVAVQYQLYEPLVKKDNLVLSRIMAAAKRIYNIIGVLIFGAGALLSFLIQYIIKDTTYPIWYIRISFFISVSGVALGYFFVHKRLFLLANEEIGLINIIDLSAKLFTVAISLISTVVFRNYLIYLVINAIYGILSNLIVHVLFKKKYPDIKPKVCDCSNEIHNLTRNLKNVVPMKLSNYVYNSTDNVVISKALGLATVALYSNYMTIINGIMGIEYLIGNVITSSMGKIIKEKQDEQHVYQLYLAFQYVQYLFVSFCVISLAILCRPFITLWIGERFIIDETCFVLLILDFYVHSMYQPAYAMFGATGKFKEDKYITLASAVMNIVVSVVLVMIIGLPGVIIGTLLTDVYIWVVRSYQMVKGYWRQNLCKYSFKMMKYSILTLTSLLVAVWASKLVSVQNSFLELAELGAICFIIPNGINILGTFKGKEFEMVVHYAGKYVRRKG